VFTLKYAKNLISEEERYQAKLMEMAIAQEEARRATASQREEVTQLQADMEAAGLTVKKFTDDQREATQQTTEGAAQSEKAITGLNQALKIVGRQFGTVGKLASVAFRSEVIAAAVAVSVAISKLKEHFAELRRKIEEGASVQVAVWKAQRERLFEAERQAKSYKEAVDDIAKSTDTLKTSEDALLAVLNAKIEAQKKWLKAMEETEIAAAGGDKEKEAEIRARYGARATEDELAAERARIDLMKQTQEAAKKEAAGAMKEAEAARAAQKAGVPGADEAAAAAAIVAARSTRTQKLQADYEAATQGKTLEELRVEAERAGQFVSLAGGEIGISAPELQYEQARKASEALKANKAEIEKNERIVKDYQDRKEAADKKVTEAVTKWKTSDVAVQAREREISTAEKVYGIRAGAVESARSPVAAGLVETAAAGAEAIRGGGRATRQQVEAMNKVSSLLNLSNLNTDTLLRMLDAMNDSEQKRAQSIKTIEQRLRIVEGGGQR